VCTCRVFAYIQESQKNKINFNFGPIFLFQMSTENFRFYIKVRTALNIQARIIHDELYSVYGDQAPSLTTVKRWSKLFREGREEIEDETRPGRPITETTSENIEQIRLLINDDFLSHNRTVRRSN